MRLRRTDMSPRIEMLPLMDVVFLLLVFFIYAMMTMAVHRGMNVALPASSTAEVDRTVQLALIVRADGLLFLDGEAVTLETLGDMLRKAASGPREAKDVGIKVFAEDSLSYQGLFRVLDVVKTSGIKKISLQARREENP